MFSIVKNNLLWKDGKYIAIATFAFATLSFIFLKILLIPIMGFFLFSLYFFRNPDRSCKDYQNDRNILISPADGKVVDVSDGEFEGYQKRISIFLSPLDVHVNWLPVSGKIKEVNYRPGKFVVAFAPKSSDINERNDIVIECDNGQQILVRQIAGFVARRICCWVKKNDAVKANEKYGMIRFGSRVDILLPANIEIKVKVGDRIRGGQTVIGRWI